MNLKKSVKGKNKKQTMLFSMPTPQPAMRLCCPHCGNDRYFLEQAEDVTITTRYLQNPDGSFTAQSDESHIQGEVKLFCGECKADLTNFRDKFIEMLF